MSLTGFGVRLLPPQPDDTGAVTPYLAPERLRGQAPDACTDVFAFGAVVYEMLAERPAFEGDTPRCWPNRYRAACRRLWAIPAWIAWPRRAFSRTARADGSACSRR